MNVSPPIISFSSTRGVRLSAPRPLSASCSLYAMEFSVLQFFSREPKTEQEPNDRDDVDQIRADSRTSRKQRPEWHPVRPVDRRNEDVVGKRNERGGNKCSPCPPLSLTVRSASDCEDANTHPHQ